MKLIKGIIDKNFRILLNSPGDYRCICICYIFYLILAMNKLFIKVLSIHESMVL